MKFNPTMVLSSVFLGIVSIVVASLLAIGCDPKMSLWHRRKCVSGFTCTGIAFLSYAARHILRYRIVTTEGAILLGVGTLFGLLGAATLILMLIGPKKRDDGQTEVNNG